MSHSDFEILLQQISQGSLVSAVMSSPRKKTSDAPRKVNIRPVCIKDQNLYQVSSHYEQKVMHQNISVDACAQLVKEALLSQFRQGMFSTSSMSYHILVNKHKDMAVIKNEVKQALSIVPHNRQKNYLLQEGIPVPFLIELGVMTPQGKIIAKKYDKFRQINRFIEMVSDIMSCLPINRPLKVIDFGCGKAYLTFALHHYLHFMEGRSVSITGLDLKQEVIDHCQNLADRLGYSTLKFSVGDINHHCAEGKVDLVICLHACDTATDAALEKAVRWGADVILAVPCCQHELYGQLESSSLAPILRHGILRERFAALATDAARAELLTILGYEVQVLEFIDMEHTPKNLLLRAVKSSSSAKQVQARERYQVFKDALQIDHSLERRFTQTPHAAENSIQ